MLSVKAFSKKLSHFISVPHKQNAFYKGKVEEILEGSLALLDALSCTQDVVSHMKESVLDLCWEKFKL